MNACATLGSNDISLCSRMRRRRGRTTVYVGGGLQLLFGIRGRRWADPAEIAAVTRGSWVWPSAAETPAALG